MKHFTRIEPTTTQPIGNAFPRVAIIKRFSTEYGYEHEFTTTLAEGSRANCVIALTPENRVIIAYQFRPGPERWMYDLPGGDVNDNEDGITAVLRELSEETGYTSNDVKLLGTSCRSAYINTTWECYIAKDCRLTTVGQNLDKSERDQGLEVKLISIEELIHYAKTDQMTDPVAVLMAYEQLKEIQSESA